MKYLFLNHKMNLTVTELQKYKEQLKNINWKHLEICIFPSFLNIPYLIKEQYKIGAQNVSAFEEGSFTGEISAKQLKNLGASYCLVGHSERRNKFHEQDEEIRGKIKELEKQNITSVLCVGELCQEEREETLKRQLSVIDVDPKNLIIAYEPVYSIGTGLVLENQKIEEAINFIKEYIKQQYQKEFPVLYGGSVDEKNITGLKQLINADGFLIGKASLTVEKVVKIVEEI